MDNHPHWRLKKRLECSYEAHHFPYLSDIL
ncbi:hypothetical protein [Enterococcus phage vB_Efs4_KEN02]